MYETSYFKRLNISKLGSKTSIYKFKKIKAKKNIIHKTQKEEMTSPLLSPILKISSR